jgi:hypothetical protein
LILENFSSEIIELWTQIKIALAGDESPRKLWFGPIFVILVDEPEQIKQLLTSKHCINKPLPYKMLSFDQGKEKKVFVE